MVDDPCPLVLIIKVQSPAAALGSCPPGNYDELVTNGEVFSCLSPSRGPTQSASRTTIVRTSTPLWAALQSFIWKQLCQPLLLFLETTVGHAVLWVDMEYHAGNHRALQHNGSSGFHLKPDGVDSTLILVSSENGSKNSLRKLLSTNSLLVHEWSTEHHSSRVQKKSSAVCT